MTDFNTEITAALEEIKSVVDEKFKDTALAADVEKAIAKAVENKATAEEIAELKTALEALEAKLDAIPNPAIIKKVDKNMNVNEVFEKSLAAGGKAEAEVIIKNITTSQNTVGAPVDTYGLTGSVFAANPFRTLASNFITSSAALKLPIRTGANGAAVSNATNKNTTASGNAGVAEITVMVKTIEAQSIVTIESASDIIGFDNFWSQDMLDEVAAVEAVQHVAAVEAIAGIETEATDVVSFDDLAELHFDVAPQYRANGAFVVSTDVMKTLRTLNTASTGGDLLFDPQIGAFRLFGQPIYENAYMAGIAAGNVVAAYGDFKKGLVIANRAGATIGRYEETKPGYYTYHASLRSGIAGWHAPALKTLTIKAA
ncbi:MAG: phage major capsid protein [Acinetobacter sp.]|uniref:phage major capsid protein n=1 Tax=Acinetobacter sp. TaxID=472 RepID=UPI00391D8CB0